MQLLISSCGENAAYEGVSPNNGIRLTRACAIFPTETHLPVSISLIYAIKEHFICNPRGLCSEYTSTAVSLTLISKSKYSLVSGEYLAIIDPKS
jgi:hypothetical protein